MSASSGLASSHFLSFVCQRRSLCPPPPAFSPFISFHLSPSIGRCVRLLRPCLLSFPFICLPASVAVSASSGLVSFHFLSFVCQHRLLCLPPFISLRCLPATVAVSASSGLVSFPHRGFCKPNGKQAVCLAKNVQSSIVCVFCKHTAQLHIPRKTQCLLRFCREPPGFGEHIDMMSTQKHAQSLALGIGTLPSMLSLLCTH